jgi:hypothetical protein
MDYKTYGANLTGAWFLFYEIKQVAKLLESGLSEAEIKEMIVGENLFQHKTRSSMTRVFPSVLRRAQILGSDLRKQLIDGTIEDGKLINLYSIYEDDLLFNEFLNEIIKEKYKSNHLLFEKRDINMYFTHKGEQSEKVAGFTEATISKLKRVYMKILKEAGILATPETGEMNRIFFDPGLKEVLLKNGAHSFVKIFVG